MGAVYEKQGMRERSHATLLAGGGISYTWGAGRSMVLIGNGDKWFLVSRSLVPISGLDPPGRWEQGVSKAGDLLPGKTGMAKFGMVHPSIQGQSAKLF